MTYANCKDMQTNIAEALLTLGDPRISISKKASLFFTIFFILGLKNNARMWNHEEGKTKNWNMAGYVSIHVFIYYKIEDQKYIL